VRKHKIRVNQFYKVRRTTVVEVEAPTAEEAKSFVDDGDFDLPDWGDPCWDEDHDLQHENTEIVDG
jgi:hypothetical protein